MEMLDRRAPGSGPPGVLEQCDLLQGIPNVSELGNAEADVAGIADEARVQR